MRVIIKNFNMTAIEMKRRWAEQDIDLLEARLRQSEEKVRKESQRVQMFRSKVISKNQEIAKLKASLAWSPDVLRRTLKQVRLDHNYINPVKDAGPEKSDKKEAESQARGWKICHFRKDSSQNIIEK